MLLGPPLSMHGPNNIRMRWQHQTLVFSAVSSEELAARFEDKKERARMFVEFLDCDQNLNVMRIVTTTKYRQETRARAKMIAKTEQDMILAEVSTSVGRSVWALPSVVLGQRPQLHRRIPREQKVCDQSQRAVPNHRTHCLGGIGESLRRL